MSIHWDKMKCDICKEKEVKYDGKTKLAGIYTRTPGVWAFMCEDCFKIHGVGLGLGKGQKLAILAFLISALCAAMPTVSAVYAGTPDHLQGKTINEVVNAIYIIEGKEKAKKPFGILSVPCDGYDDCRKIATNTVRNNIKRYVDYGYKTHKDYYSFLASRYCPIGANNDPYRLNNNWEKNLRNILKIN